MSQDARELYSSAKVALEEGDADRCLQYLENCQVALNGSNARIESVKCQALVQKGDWINAAIAYKNYDRLLPSDSRNGDAYAAMLEYKQNIWLQLDAIEKQKSEALKKEITDDLVNANAEELATNTKNTTKVAKLNEANEQQFYQVAIKSKDAALLQIYKEVGASKDNIAVVEKELDKQANPSKYIYEAIKTDNLSEFNYLLSLGLDVNMNVADGTPMLHAAIGTKAIKVFKTLLSLNPNLESIDKNGDTPLLKAVREQKEDFMTLLLNAGANYAKPNSKNGQTAFQVAVINTHTSISEILVKKGADPNEVLVFEGIGINPLSEVAMNTKNYYYAESLVNLGAKLDAQNADGSTPIQVASDASQKEFVRLFLKYGANINHQNNKGQTALHLAVIKADTAMTAFLIQRGGANKEIIDNDKLTPLKLAQEKGYEPVVKVIRDSDPLINKASTFAVQEKQYTLQMEKIVLTSYIKQKNREGFGHFLKGLGYYAVTGALVMWMIKNPDSDVAPYVTGGIGGPTFFVGTTYLLSDWNRITPKYRQTKARLKSIKSELRELQ
ncbi:MAG: ankyrin repeat domain-containing protein [Pelobium sp.]